jgi:REP element-mobilizing transposase RayT
LAYYERHLPHWQPEGAALFITWRLHGSLPQVREYSFAAFNRELDKAATGPRWLQDEQVAQCVVDALQYGERQLRLYELRAWVLMSNHVHILIEPAAKMPRITKAIKNYSAREANRILSRTGAFWQDESYDHWVRDAKELEQVVMYIESNPVTAGLVESVDKWRWSSACGIK